MKKVVAYPVYAETASIYRHRALIKDYEIIGCYAPEGYGLGGRDSSYVDEGVASGLIVTHNIKALIDVCEGLLLLPYPDNPSMDKQTRACVDLFAQMKKEIILCTNQSDLWIEEYAHNVIRLKQHYDVSMFITTKPIVGDKEQPKAPVVFITGLDEGCGKFEAQLALIENLRNEGIKVSYISSRRYGELFGGHSFPLFMFEGRYSEKEKIHMIHDLILKIDREEKPDIIILGIPGDTISIITNADKHYGIFLYEISTIIHADFTVFCLHSGEYKEAFFSALDSMIHSKYGISIDCYIMSNIGVNYKSFLPSFGDGVAYDMNDSVHMDVLRIKHQKINNLYIGNSSDDLMKLTRYIINTLNGFTHNPKMA